MPGIENAQLKMIVPVFTPRLNNIAHIHRVNLRSAHTSSD